MLVKWSGYPETHTNDWPMLLDMRRLAQQAFGADASLFSFLDTLKAVDSAEQFGASRHSSVHDVPFLPLSAPIESIRSLAVEAKSRAPSVSRFVSDTIAALPPRDLHVLQTLTRAYKPAPDLSPDDYVAAVLSVLQPSDVVVKVEQKSAPLAALQDTATATSASSSTDSASAASPSASVAPSAASSMDTDAEDPQIELVLRVSKAEYAAANAERARHYQCVTDTATGFGYALFRLPANGHCGPNAFLDQLACREIKIPNMVSVADVRAAIGKELLGTHADHYFMMVQGEMGMKQFQREVSDWVSSGQWNSAVMDLFWPAVAEAFGVIIVMLRSIQPFAMLVLPRFSAAKQLMSVGHILIKNHEHYDSLRPLDLESERKIVHTLTHSVRFV